MPHLRARHLQESFDLLIRHARIVGILGHRQVGKTTFLEANASEIVTLDDEDTFLSASRSPKRFIQSLRARRSGIDECQLVPGLFPALKVRVGTSSTPGRFILTGSVRFSSRKAIRESLTGRIVNLELMPFCLTEIENEGNSSFLPEALGAASFDGFVHRWGVMESVAARRTRSIEKYLSCGGLPGLFHVRDERTRARLLSDILETVLDRDVRLIRRTSLPFQQIHEYCRLIATDPLRILRPTTLKRRCRIQESTQRHLLCALEAAFLVRRIPVQGDCRGDLFWFEDQIERGHFVPEAAGDAADWVTLVYRNARAQFQYKAGEHAELFHYRTRGGAMVPFGIRTANGYLGLYPVQRKTDVNLSLRRSAESFLKKYGRSKVLFVTRFGKDSDILTDRIAVVPAQAALF